MRVIAESEYLQGKQFKGGNYSRAETIRGNTVYEKETSREENRIEFSRLLIDQLLFLEFVIVKNGDKFPTFE